jgi:hypothetical protein
MPNFDLLVVHDARAVALSWDRDYEVPGAWRSVELTQSTFSAHGGSAAGARATNLGGSMGFRRASSPFSGLFTCPHLHALCRDARISWKVSALLFRSEYYLAIPK